MARPSFNQFIGPLRPGQKPPTFQYGDKDEQWTVLDLLKTDNDRPTYSSSNTSNQLKAKKPKKFIRAAGGTTWEDSTLADWDHDDYRVFIGDLGNDVTDELLKSTFEKYSSFLRAKVVRENRTQKSKGYGFISFKEPQDYARAIKDWDGKYLGSRPVKLRKSNWKDRSIEARKNKASATIEPNKGPNNISVIPGSSSSSIG